MSRYCPFCGSVLAKDPTSCPQCRSGIGDREWVTEAQHTSMKRTKGEYRRQIGIRHKSHRTAMILSVVPAFLGLLGFGQIYLDRRDPTGWTLLILGIVWAVFSGSCAYTVSKTDLVPGIFLTVALIFFLLAYLLTAAVGIKHAYDGILGFR